MSTRQRERDGTDDADIPPEGGGPADGSAEPDAASADEEPAAKADPAPAPAEPAAAGPGAATTESGEDRWSAFAPVPATPPTRLRRIATRVGHLLGHEWTIAAAFSVLLAVAMTWPTLRDPLHTLPRDLGDPTLVTWMLAWSGHILVTDPGQLWQGNAFFPEPFSYAFTESLLGYAPLGLFGSGPEAAILRYNILYVLIYALAYFGAYALVRQLGAGRIGAGVAGVAFAYAPWRLAQAGHLHVISTGGIALALAMLARGHGWSLRHGYRPERRHAGWALAGWLVAAWQVTVGIGIGIPFAYVLLLVGVVGAVGWLFTGRPRLGWRLLAADLGGGVAFAGTFLLISLPYRKVLELHPEAQRTPEAVALFSAPLRGFFIAPPDSLVWGDLHAAARGGLPWHPEMTLLPGFALCGLAAAGMVFSIWRLRTRLLLAVGVLVTVLLGMGSQFNNGDHPSYLTLYQFLVGWDALRTPGRLVIWTTLLLGILAAGAVTAFGRRARELTAERVPAAPGAWLRLATLVPLVVVLLEGTNMTPHPVVPAAPAALRTAPGPIMVLPSHELFDMQVMLWSTDRFTPMVNGGSSFVPRSLRETRTITQSFPDPASIDHLRRLGVETVLLLPGWAAGTAWAGAAEIPVDGLGITREEVDGAVVYDLNP